ncbi:DUF1430 domain-containing protein [Clostridium sp. DL1XJH146]
MKGIKYIVSFCVIFIGILIIGESHIFYLDNFYTLYDNTTLYLQHDTTSEEMIADILNSAHRNKVEVFTFTRTQRDVVNTEYDIYATAGTEKYINENSNIFEGNYTSLFVGNTNFKFNDFNDIHSIENMHDYYFIGSEEQVYQFKMDLINKYAGNHPKQGYIDKEARNNTVAIWILIISIILLLSFYDILSQKKENVVRISMGEKISKIIWTNIILDSLALIVIFIVILSVLSRYSYVFFNFKISIILFIILLFINGTLYLNLYFYDIKEVFSNSKGSKKLLSINYGLKLVTTIITIFIISSNIAFSAQSYKLYKQKSFFEKHSDYYYIKFMYRPIVKNDGSMKDTWNESEAVQSRFYKEFFEKFHSTALKDNSGYIEQEAIIANRNSFDYLSSKIDELRDSDLDKDVYFMLPEKMKENPEIIDNLYGKLCSREETKFDYEVIYYHEDIEVIGIDEDSIYGSNLVKNPCISYINISLDKAGSNNIYLNNLDYLNDVMYKISSDNEFNEFNEFLVEHNLKDEEVYKINVLEKYENSWIIAKRVLYINLVFSVLVLFLEFIIINSIIRLEYEVNAIELSIKKVMGYSVLEKNWKIIMMTVITTISSILISVIVVKVMEIKEVYYLAFGGSMILILELFVITFYIRRIENCKIQKILKGGNL